MTAHSSRGDEAVSQAGSRQGLWAVAVTIVVLLSCGLGQRYLDKLLTDADARPIALARPLSTLEVASWQGTDIPMDERVLEVAGCDDYVRRRYTDPGTGETVDLYVSYAARPAKMLGHRPQVCYEMHGWTPGGSRRDHFGPVDGTEYGCLVHQFFKSRPGTEAAVVVLNYYVFRGRHTAEWTDFWGPGARLPNLSRDPSYYVAQVQISAGVHDESGLKQAEAAVKRFAAETVLSIRALLPEAEEM